MSEPKLFKEDCEFDVKAREILKPLSKPLADDSNEFMLDCVNCYKFADIIIEKGLILFTNVIPQILYREILNNVIAQFNNIGTYNGYYFLMKLFFGNSSIITFETLAPAHLKINVSNVDIRVYDWIDDQNNNMVDAVPTDNIEEPFENNQIIFADKILDLTPANLLKLINNIRPAGYVVDINII